MVEWLVDEMVGRKVVAMVVCLVDEKVDRKVVLVDTMADPWELMV